MPFEVREKRQRTVSTTSANIPWPPLKRNATGAVVKYTKGWLERQAPKIGMLAIYAKHVVRLSAISVHPCPPDGLQVAMNAYDDAKGHHQFTPESGAHLLTAFNYPTRVTISLKSPVMAR
jgi:hypothetical protein